MTKLYDYQREGAILLQRANGVALLADEMGLGKTLQTLTYLKWNPEARPAIVICPPTIKLQWEREAALHVGMRSDVLWGTQAKSFGLVKPQIVIINYQILENWLPVLRALNPKVIIADECQAVSNPEAKQTKLVHTLAKGVPHRIAISGTPLTNRPYELYSILNWLRPDLFNSSYAYANDFCNARMTSYGWDYSGAKNLDRLHKLLIDNNVMIRRLKKDVLSQLPNKRDLVVPINIYNRKGYVKASTDFIKWLRTNYNSVKAEQASKVAQLAKTNYLLQFAAELKMPSVMEWLRSFLAESDDKINLFCVHRKTIETLHENLNGQSIVIHGGITGQKRQIAIDHFLSNKKYRVLVGQIKAAGAGWSGKGVANTAFIEYWWNPATHNQAADRCHGLGRGIEGRESTNYWLVANGTIEEDMVSLLDGRQKMFDQVMDGDPNLTNMNIYEELIAKLEGRTHE